MFHREDRERYDENMIAREKQRRDIISEEDASLKRRVKEKGELIGHDCFEGARVYYKNFHTVGLGEHYHWEFSLSTCKHCGFKYFRAFLDSDGYSHSGRWVMGRVPQGATSEDFILRDGLILLANFDIVFYGGCYWKHAGEWSRSEKGFGRFPFEIYCH